MTSRDPKGVPTGGRFAAQSHAEVDISLSDQPEMSWSDQLRRLDELDAEWTASGGQDDFYGAAEIEALSASVYAGFDEKVTAGGVRAELAKLEFGHMLTKRDIELIFRRAWAEQENGPAPEVPEDRGPPTRSEMHEAFAASVREAFPDATHVEFDMDGPGGSPEVNWVVNGTDVVGRSPALVVGFFSDDFPVEIDPVLKRRMEADLSEILDTEGSEHFEGAPWKIPVGRGVR